MRVMQSTFTKTKQKIFSNGGWGGGGGPGPGSAFVIPPPHPDPVSIFCCPTVPEIFPSFGYATIVGEGLQILTFTCTRHLWQ